MILSGGRGATFVLECRSAGGEEWRPAREERRAGASQREEAEGGGEIGGIWEEKEREKRPPPTACRRPRPAAAAAPEFWLLLFRQILTPHRFCCRCQCTTGCSQARGALTACSPARSAATVGGRRSATAMGETVAVGRREGGD
uniref:Uncharacterized protein n=1 Tax=Oryza sativa subsp. japonica TaxID=39947 RepID=Q67UQ6_ORYSJ|nr:hypothetical protein [Oryza sativa Japonica Group]